jgi:hypothetical protein
MTRDEIAARRADIKAQITNMQTSIGYLVKELEQSRQKVIHLEERDYQLMKRDQELEAVGMCELIRMCNTPCYRYRSAF